MDGETLKLVKKDGEYLCPLCLKKGLKNTIMAYQLNLYEAFYNCSNLQCHFPTFSQKYYVPPFQRHYLNMHEPIKYPQVYYGPLPYLDGVWTEDEICTDEDEEAEQNVVPEKKIPFDKIRSEEIDDLLNDIFKDCEEVDKESLQVCPEIVLAGVGTNELTPPNRSEPNYNSSEKHIDVNGESQCADQITSSSELCYNDSGMFHGISKRLHSTSGKTARPIEQQPSDSDGGAVVSPSDVRVTCSTNDVPQTCEISAVTSRSSLLENDSSFPVGSLDRRMNSIAPHLTENLPVSDHSYCKSGTDLPISFPAYEPFQFTSTSYAPFEFTCEQTKKKKGKSAVRKKKRKRK